MKYRHVFHAGNFADVHKHVTLLALLRLLARKDKGFLAVDTHAGRGLYDLTSADARQSAEARTGIEPLLAASEALAASNKTVASGELPEEIADYLQTVRKIRRAIDQRHVYPGSPLLLLAALRPQDRLVLIETQTEEHAALRGALRQASSQLQSAAGSEPTIECADGYRRLAAWLPPIERRALILIDPPYEETARDFQAVAETAQAALRRLANAVIVIWYPIKDGKDTELWRERLLAALPLQPGGAPTEACALELTVHPADNRVGLNGSGMLVLNPPWQFAERANVWMPFLHRQLDPQQRGGWSVG